jgi:hypothetical protein
MRRRNILLLGTACFISMLLVAGNLHNFLAYSCPKKGATCLIVEGWLPSFELKQCASLFLRGNYTLAIVAARREKISKATTRFTSTLDRARSVLIGSGVPAEKIVVIEADTSYNRRTFSSAIAVKTWLGQCPNAPQKIDVVSGGAHARKTYEIYRRVLGKMVEIGSLSVRPSEYDPARWWLSPIGIAYTTLDLVGYFYALIWPVPD